MRLRCLIGSLVCGLALAGCGLMEPVQTTGRYLRNSLSPKSTESDWAQEPVESWVEEAGNEARGHRPVEHDPDPWYAKYILSEKARSIERNMGIQ